MGAASCASGVTPVDDAGAAWAVTISKAAVVAVVSQRKAGMAGGYLVGFAVVRWAGEGGKGRGEGRG